MSKYLICTLEGYAEIVDSVNSNESIKKHSPIYSEDGTEVLVKGVGNMTLEEVRSKDKWIVTQE